MHRMAPKEQHEQLLATADKEKIVQHLNDGWDQGVTKVAVALARQCILYVHFQRLWKMRVSDLDAKLSTDRYMWNIYKDKQLLHRKLKKDAPP